MGARLWQPTRPALALTMRRASCVVLVLSLAAHALVPRLAPFGRGRVRLRCDEFEGLNFRELQAACKAASLPAKGAAVVLRQRLRDAAAAAPRMGPLPTWRHETHDRHALPISAARDLIAVLRWAK